jgi:hypothetical protein
VAFVLCALLAGASLWFFPHGMIELHKPGVNVSNVKIAELLSGEDYMDSSAFRVTAMYELNSLLFGFEKAAKLPALEAVLDALDPSDAAGSDVVTDAIVVYIKQLAGLDYFNSDLHAIVNGALDEWRNGGRYFSYSLYDATGDVSVLTFDFEQVRNNEQVIRPVVNPDDGLIHGEEYDLDPSESDRAPTVSYAIPENGADTVSIAAAFYAAYPEQTREILTLGKELNADNSRTATGNLDAAGLRYFATDGKTVVTNVAALQNKTDFGSADFASDPEYLSVRGGSVSDTSAALKPITGNWSENAGPNHSMSTVIAWGNLSCFLSYPETVLAEKTAAYNAQAGIIWDNFVPAAVCAALALVLLILLIVWTGRKVKGRSFALDSPRLRLGQAPVNVGFAHSSGRYAPCAVRFASQIKDLGQKGKPANDGGANFSLLSEFCFVGGNLQAVFSAV